MLRLLLIFDSTNFAAHCVKFMSSEVRLTIAQLDNKIRLKGVCWILTPCAKLNSENESFGYYPF